jgi:Zn-dependent peptidase ImmA (M78 family)
MSDRERRRREQQRRDSFSINEWCKHRRISRAMFYLLDQQGLAPKTYYVGARRFISDEADVAWLTAREAETENNAAA